ncbi:metal-dependent hydrolase [Magnetococcales bacterium HHB-1]
MPDLFAHLTSGLVATYPEKARRWRAPFVIGTLLPDIMTRVPHIVFVRFLDWKIQYFLDVLHSPVAFLLASFSLSFLFVGEKRETVFMALFLGTLLHQVLDLMQEPFHDGGYPIFFPLSYQEIHWDWFYYQDSVYLFPFFLLLTGFLLFDDWRSRRINKKAS